MSDDPDIDTPVVLERARQLFAQAKESLADSNSVDEVLTINDQAEVIRHAAHIAHDRGLEADAIEIRWRAQRRLGQLIKLQGDAGLLNKGAPGPGRGKAGVRATPAFDAPPTLQEIGVDKNLAKLARVQAAWTDKEFEGHVFALQDRARVTPRKPLWVSPPKPPKPRPAQPRRSQQGDPTFESRVNAEVEKRIKDRIETELPGYQKAMEEARAIKASAKGVFAEAEFNLIRRVIHPDTGKGCSDEDRNEAFRLFNDQKLVLMKPPPKPTENREARNKAKAEAEGGR